MHKGVNFACCRFMSSTVLTERGSRKRGRFVLGGLHSSAKALNILKVSVKDVKRDCGVQTFQPRGCLCPSGAGWVAGWGEAEWGSCADLRQQAGPADSRPRLRDRRGSQPAHHPGPHMADPGLLRPHWRGNSGEHLHFVLLPLPNLVSHASNSVSRKGWIGCARASTPRKNSFDCHLCKEEQLQQHTHTHIHRWTLTHTAPSWAFAWRDLWM